MSSINTATNPSSMTLNLMQKQIIIVIFLLVLVGYILWAVMPVLCFVLGVCIGVSQKRRMVNKLKQWNTQAMEWSLQQQQLLQQQQQQNLIQSLLPPVKKRLSASQSKNTTLQIDSKLSNAATATIASESIASSSVIMVASSPLAVASTSSSSSSSSSQESIIHFVVYAVYWSTSTLLFVYSWIKPKKKQVQTS